MKTYTHNTASATASTKQDVPTPVMPGGLKHKLMRSHMAVAVIALFALMLSLSTTLMVGTNVSRLTELRGPTARSSSRALAGLHRTLASLRGWVSVADPRFKKERQQAWEQDVTTSLHQLEALSVNWTIPENHNRLVAVSNLLKNLKEAQWYIEDVAQSPGNEPARVILDLEIYPLSVAILSSITGLIEIEQSRSPQKHEIRFLGWMADMRYSLSLCQSLLSDYAERGYKSTVVEIQDHLKTIAQCTDNLATQQSTLTLDQIDLLSSIVFDFQAYDMLVDRVLDARKQSDWNVAQHLLVTQAIPKAREAAELLKAMSTSQAKLSAAEGARVRTICHFAIACSLGMIVILIAGAYVASARGAKRITDPIRILSLATEEFANGRLLEDIPITTDDEIGQLTQTFNQMRHRLYESDLEVRKSDTRIRALVDTAADGILTTDERGIVLTMNPQAEKMFGYPSEEIVGCNVKMLMPSPYQELHDGYLQQYLATGVKTIVGSRRELLGKRKDKTTFPIEISVSEIFTDSERSYSGIVTDISERIAMEKKLADVNHDLVKTSRTAGMAEIATGVLHNVGNVLNSVNISATLVAEKVNKSRLPNLAKTSAMLLDQGENIGAYISEHEKGKLIPGYLAKLAGILADEQRFMLDELRSLTKNIDHIKKIVKAQQTHARATPLTELASITETVEDALNVNAQALQKRDITVMREYGDLPLVNFDKQKLLQILINLIRNARQAIEDSSNEEKRLTIRTTESNDDTIKISIIDTGSGITKEHISRIFQHGFTTKTDGHGFGLHSCGNAAKEMQGSLEVNSEGHNQGATFTVQFPVTHETVKV